eukprot:3311768-Rhodomonas_salina.1
MRQIGLSIGAEGAQGRTTLDFLPLFHPPPLSPSSFPASLAPSEKNLEEKLNFESIFSGRPPLVDAGVAPLLGSNPLWSCSCAMR